MQTDWRLKQKAFLLTSDNNPNQQTTTRHWWQQGKFSTKTMKRIEITARREAYGIEDIRNTMTVGELVHFLTENFDDDTPIYLNHDNGYTFGGITEDRIIEEGEDDEDGYTHSITISEQVDIRDENGGYRGTDELSIPLSQDDCKRPDRRSFYAWLCALYPQYTWQADDGDDWDDDPDTDYCQYTAQIDPADDSHIYLAVYNRTAKQ